jgi:hypothetical protein
MSFEAMYRGPKPKREAGEPRIVTSVGIPVTLYVEMKKRGLKPAQILETGLRAALAADDLTPEQAVAAMRAERDAKIESAVVRIAEGNASELEAAYTALQSPWNQYLAGGGTEGRPLAAKLSWIDGRKARYPAIASLDNQAILGALEAK